MKRSLPTLLAWSAVFFITLGAWLFTRSQDPAEPDAPALCVVLVDASASVRARRSISWLPWVRRELLAVAEAARVEGEELAVVLFGDEVQRAFGPGEPGAFVERLQGQGGGPFDPRLAGQQATRLSEALSLAARLAAEGGRAPGRLVLIGDGEWTHDEPRAALGEVRAAGLALSLVAVPPAELADLAILGLDVPQGIEEGAPLVARVRLRFEPGREAVEGALLFVDVDHAGEIYTASTAVDLPTRSGPSEFEVPIDLGIVASGRNTLTARSVLLPGPRDAVPANDRMGLSFVAGGELVIGVVAGEIPRAQAWLAPAGNSALAGVQFHFLEPDEVAAELGNLDALVSLDLPLERLPETSLAAFVQGGGGWFATAGWNFLHDFALGRGGRLHELLPSEPAPLDPGPREVVLLVDGSGSMRGEPFEMVREACLELVAASLAEDRVSLRFFTGTLNEEHLVKGAASGGGELSGAAEAAARLVTARVPGGTTFIMASLDRFAALRQGSSARGLALLLTDGREQDALIDPEARARNLSASLASSRTRLVVIGVGDELDEEFLARLTPEGEEPLRAGELDELVRIFRREVSGANWREGSFPVLSPPQSPGSLAGAVLRGDVDGELPPVQRVVRNVLRPGAETLWSTEEDPLLSLQRVGLGRVAFFASSPSSDWARGWAGRSGIGEPRLFASLLRWLARGTRDGALAGRPRLTARGNTLRLEGLGASDAVEFEAQVLDTDARRTGTRAGREVGRVRFSLADPEGGELVSAREGRLQADLAGRLATPGHVLTFERGGSPVVLSVPPVRPPEMGAWKTRLEEEDLTFGRAPKTAASAHAGASGQDPTATAFLLFGMVLLASSCFAALRAVGKSRHEGREEG